MSGVRRTKRSEVFSDEVGVFNGEGPPVPIPNTEVKLTSAENTCLATDWEDRSMPTQKPEFIKNSGFFLFKYNTIICNADFPLCVSV